MKYPRAAKVIPLQNYTLRVEFDNGEVKIFDVLPYISGSWYGQLRNWSIFSAVRTDGHSVVWPGGQDIAPHELYALSLPLKQ